MFYILGALKKEEFEQPLASDQAATQL